MHTHLKYAYKYTYTSTFAHRFCTQFFWRKRGKPLETLRSFNGLLFPFSCSEFYCISRQGVLEKGIYSSILFFFLSGEELMLNMSLLFILLLTCMNV